MSCIKTMIGLKRSIACSVLVIAPLSSAKAIDSQKMKERTEFIASRYLQIWSSSNVSPVAGVPYMYGRTVQFYGKTYTQGDLKAEKRRAILQWPIRHYVHRPGTMRIDCNYASRKCAARSTIDFSVSNPTRGTRKSGSAKFDLGVSFTGPHPVILYEGGSSNKNRDL